MNKLWVLMLTISSVAFGQVNGTFANLTAKSVNGQLNAAKYCTTPGTLDQSCLANAITADSTGASIYVPAGAYSGSTSNIAASNVNIELDPGASLNYVLNFNGPGYTLTNTATATGSYAVGVTSFSGNFSALSGCPTVMVQQTSPTASNQIGVEFFTLVSATSTTLTINTPTRYTYATPSISCISGAAQYIGTVAVRANSIPGNYTSFLSVGSYVKVDNTIGTDTPGLPSTPYFEIAKVLSITTSAVTFESPLHMTYGNPWLVKMSMLSNINIAGGYIQNVNMYYVANTAISNIGVQSFNTLWAYNFTHSNITANSASAAPVGYGLTFAWHGSVSNINAYGANSSADNANIKIGQVQDTSFSNLNAWSDVATAQGAYGIMFDVLFTPYSIWNANDSVVGISQSVAGTATVNGVYLAGFRNGALSGATSMSGFKIMLGSQMDLSDLSTPADTQIRSGDNYHITSISTNAISIGGDSSVTNSSFGFFHIGDCTLSESPGRCIWIRNSSNNLTFSHGNFATVANSQSFFINDNLETNMYFDDIVDAPTGTGVSVYNSGGATIYLGVNRFTGTIAGTIGMTYIPNLNATTATIGQANLSGASMTNANTTVTGPGLTNTSTGGHSWNYGAVGSGGMLGCVAGEFGFADFTAFGNSPICMSNSQVRINGHLGQYSANNFAGTCAMASSTSCTVTLVSGVYASTPVCIATAQGTSTSGGAVACSIPAGGATITVTAATANSNTWGVVVIGNPK